MKKLPLILAGIACLSFVSTPKSATANSQNKAKELSSYHISDINPLLSLKKLRFLGLGR